MIMQLVFLQSFSETEELPQIQFPDRLLDIPIATQRWVFAVQTVQKSGEIPQVQLVAVDVPVTAATSSSSSPWQTAENRRFSTGAVFAWLWTSLRSFGGFFRFVHRQGHDGLSSGFSRILRPSSHSVHSDVSAHFSAFDDQQLLVIEGSGGAAVFGSFGLG